MRALGYIIVLLLANYLAISLGIANGRGERENAKSILMNILFFSLGVVGGALWFE